MTRKIDALKSLEMMFFVFVCSVGYVNSTHPWVDSACKDSGSPRANCSEIIKAHSCDDPKYGASTRQRCPLSCGVCSVINPSVGPGAFTATPDCNCLHRGASDDFACTSPLVVLIVRRCVVQVLLPSRGQTSASVYFIESLHRAQKHITMEQLTRSVLFQAIRPAGCTLTLATHG